MASPADLPIERATTFETGRQSQDREGDGADDPGAVPAARRQVIE
jgi:hypothetical protein